MLSSLGNFPWHQDIVLKLDQQGAASLIECLSADTVLAGLRWEMRRRYIPDNIQPQM